MQNKPSIVFLGTPDFAVPTLERLLENDYPVVAVVTAPDKPAGRGQKILSSPVKDCAVKHGIKVLQPTNLKDPAFIDELKGLHADLQIVVAFRMLPEAVWAMPRLGTFNLHASLLPQYRGAAPINWSIIRGEKKTGITTFFLRHEIDTGDIIFREEVPIEYDDNAGSLHDKLMLKGADLVLKTVQAIGSGSVKTTHQDKLSVNEELKSAPKLNRDNTRLSLYFHPEEARDFIRGLSPYPAAHTMLTNDNGIGFALKIFAAEAKLATHPHPSGTVESDGRSYLRIYLPGGYVDLTDLQLSGRNRMKIKDFLNGLKLEGRWKVE